MSRKTLNIVHLYPKEMNIYGDTGNRIILQNRIDWRGINTNVELVGIGEVIPKDTDIILGGGGQDAGQDIVQKDLFKKADDLKSMAADGVSMLMVCGMYQLFGHHFVTSEQTEISGISLLPLETVAGPERLIGNVHIDTSFGLLVGYENHSGRTYLESEKHALGRPILGAGNNGEDKTEGCVVKNVFGTYMHGPVFSKNPKFTDEIILRALLRKYGTDELTPLDDEIELNAYRQALKRPR